MKRPDKITQGKLNRLEAPTDMPDIPWIQWRVENVEEMTRFLENYEVRMKRIPGDQLLIQTRHTRGDIQLAPGDSLVITSDFAGRPRLGVVRRPESVQVMEGDGLQKEASNIAGLKSLHSKPRITH